MRKLGLAGLAVLLLCAVSGNAEPGVVPPPEPVKAGFYVDPLGHTLEFTPVYEGWFGPRPKQYPLRAIVENVGVLALELGIYWYDPSTNFVDWQFPSLGAKLTSADSFRFDDNLLGTNYVFHPFAGTLHYVFTRTNGYGVGTGLLAAAGSSALYEFVLEWKEVVSFNDLLVTPMGGVAMGEFFHQLGEYLNSEPGAGRSHSGVAEVAHQGTAAVLGLPRYVHRALDGPDFGPDVAPDNLGLSSAFWHRFRLLGLQQSMVSGQGSPARLYGVAGSFELAAMPGFRRVGRFSRFFSSGNFSSMSSHVAWGERAQDIDLTLDSHLFGHYAQDFVAAPGGKRGQSNELALAVGLDFVNQDWPGWRDQYGIVHLLRPTERVVFALGPAEVALGADVAIDFAGVHSGAYRMYMASYGMEGTRASLQRHGYTYNWGLSAGGFITCKVGSVEFGVRARSGRYESIEGADREQEDVTRELHGTEGVTRLSGYFRVEPEGSPAAGKLELGRDERWGSFGGLAQKSGFSRVSTALGVRF